MDFEKIKEIVFGSDTKERKRFFKAASFAHPAKMILPLQIYLIENYTNPGETILDPMAGSGTILIACTLGRNVVCVELEEKFVKMQQDNWQKIKAMGPMLGHKIGEATILQGDARQLDGLLVDNCIFSPPYAEAHDGKNLGIGDTDHPDLRNRSYLKNDNPNQIANLPYGEISAVISSPPYEASISGKELPESEKLIERKSGKEKWGKHLRLGRSQLSKYSADAIISSPPYENSVEKTIEGTSRGIRTRMIKEGKTPPACDYGNSNNNIGNLTSDNYLAAMLQVYRQCYLVLRDGGLMCLVTKNFIRNKKIVRLDLDTIKLCEQAGFTLIERLKRKITHDSFWRILYYRKYPTVARIDCEDILIFNKG